MWRRRCPATHGVPNAVADPSGNAAEQARSVESTSSRSTPTGVSGRCRCCRRRREVMGTRPRRSPTVGPSVRVERERRPSGSRRDSGLSSTSPRPEARQPCRARVSRPSPSERRMRRTRVVWSEVEASCRQVTQHGSGRAARPAGTRGAPREPSEAGRSPCSGSGRRGPGFGPGDDDRMVDAARSDVRVQGGVPRHVETSGFPMVRRDRPWLRSFDRAGSFALRHGSARRQASRGTAARFGRPSRSKHHATPLGAARSRVAGRAVMSEPPSRTRTHRPRAMRRGVDRRLPVRAHPRGGARVGPGGVTELASHCEEGGGPRVVDRRADRSRLRERRHPQSFRNGKPMRATGAGTPETACGRNGLSSGARPRGRAGIAAR